MKQYEVTIMGYYYITVEAESADEAEAQAREIFDINDVYFIEEACDIDCEEEGGDDESNA